MAGHNSGPVESGTPYGRPGLTVAAKVGVARIAPLRSRGYAYLRV